jgi:hypothetical protein
MNQHFIAVYLVCNTGWERGKERFVVENLQYGQALV